MPPTTWSHGIGKECQRSPATGQPVSDEPGEAHRLPDEGDGSSLDLRVRLA
jgi:hypothetical protein